MSQKPDEPPTQCRNAIREAEFFIFKTLLQSHGRSWNHQQRTPESDRHIEPKQSTIDWSTLWSFFTTPSTTFNSFKPQWQRHKRSWFSQVSQHEKLDPFRPSSKPCQPCWHQRVDKSFAQLSNHVLIHNLKEPNEPTTQSQNARTAALFIYLYHSI